jgi:hypothetical protein
MYKENYPFLSITAYGVNVKTYESDCFQVDQCFFIWMINCETMHYAVDHQIFRRFMRSMLIHISL